MTARPEPRALRWAFSTLGCADLTYPQVCQLAGEFAIEGIELRGLGGRMDMPEYCAEQGLTVEGMLELCRRHRAQLVVAGSSVKLTDASEKDRVDLIAFCDWANRLRIPYVRVFGGGRWGDALTESDYQCAVGLIEWWGAQKAARQWQLELLLETHDAFSGSGPCLELNRRLSHPLHLIWDSHHTWRIGGEPLDYTLERIGSLVRHVHIKDSVDHPSARHPYTYVLPGEGQMPMGEVVALLQEQRFQGFVSLEWERHWHTYLPPLKEALTVLADQPWYKSAAHDRRVPAPAH